MAGITIINVQVIATCPKHSNTGEWADPVYNKVPVNIHGEPYKEEYLYCMECTAFGDEE